MISIFDVKGCKTKTIELSHQKVDINFVSGSLGRKVSNVVYWDKCG